MSALSQIVDEELARELRDALERGEFPGISLQHAMEFLLSDGIVPASGLPVSSILALEDWARARSRHRAA
jgi:hypothetical protein